MKNLLHKLPTFSRVSQFARLKTSWGSIALLALVITIGIINHKSGTILTGWDNLHPEFNLGLNIKRSIFAVWQEYQSLGLLGGMGHASDLVRQIFLLIISPIIPMESLRYVATIITLLIGSIGTYQLIKTFLAQNLKQKEALGFIGGLFYLLNIATIQTYFVAFEAFTSHYAALPWLLYGALKFLHEKSYKSLVLFSLILLLATPSAYIPTLFVAFLIGLSVIMLGLFFQIREKKSFLIRTAKMYLLIILINAFWLFPFLYFTLTSAHITVDSKMNQMATDNIFNQNKEFGDTTDVMQLKGFWFSNVEPNLQGNFTYMMGPWKEHLAQPLVTTASFLLFFIVLLGLVFAIKKKSSIRIAFVLLFLFTFTMLATNTPPFSWLVAVFREIPLFSQAFRFPFTKFSILAALAFSVFFALGTHQLFLLLKKFARKFAVFGLLIPVAFLMITSFPVFTGNLFYEKEQIKLPEEYSKTFDFFNKKDPHTRIATLPMHTFWGWNYYEWGYGGSGFLWYGIQQPIIDRAFDVWSKSSENSYFELSHALYSKDSDEFLKVLEKYQITWLLLDKNIYSPSSPRALFHEKTEDVLAEISSITKEETFGDISIYKVNLNNKPQDFLTSTGNIPTVNSYIHSNTDYMETHYADEKTPTIYFPFRTLFTGKDQQDKEFSTNTTDESIVFTAPLPENTVGKTLLLPSLLSEDFIPAELIMETDTTGTLIISVRILPPKVIIADTQLSAMHTSSYPLFIIPHIANSSFKLTANDIEFQINSSPKKERTMLSLHQNNYIYLTDTENGASKIQILEPEFLRSLPQINEQIIQLTKDHSGKTLTVEIPKILDGTNGSEIMATNYTTAKDCNNFRNGSVSAEKNGSDIILSAQNDTACISYYHPSSSHSQGYFIDIEAANNSGMPFHFWILNPSQQYSVIDTYLNQNTPHNTFIVPPMDLHGRGYSFHFDSVSMGNSESSNTLRNLSIYPIPFSFLTTLKTNSDFTPSENKLSFESTHPHESLYVLNKITAKNDSPATLLLSQTYHSGWNAYQIKSEKMNLLVSLFPFFFGEKINSHQIVNNWQNGWKIENPNSLNDTSIIIIFLPQYLEYLGLLLLGGLFFILALKADSIQRIFHLYNSFFEFQAEKLRDKITQAQNKNQPIQDTFPYSIDLSDRARYWRNISK